MRSARILRPAATRARGVPRKALARAAVECPRRVSRPGHAMRTPHLISVARALALPAEARCDGLRAGAAVAEITPPVGLPLWGYAARHDAPSVGVRDPLFARCVVLDDGRE